MIAVLKQNVTERQIEQLTQWIKNQNVDVHLSKGKDYTILGLIGDTGRIDRELLESLEIVESVKLVSEPFKQVNRKLHPEDTIITVGSAKIGGGHFALIAGPCSVETEEQIIEVARQV